MIPKLLNNLFASFSFINFDFLLPHTRHFVITLFYHFYFLTYFNQHFLCLFCSLNNKSTYFTTRENFRWFNITFLCCFKNVDLLWLQLKQFQFFVITLFLIIFLPFWVFYVNFLQLKQLPFLRFKPCFIMMAIHFWQLFLVSLLLLNNLT